MAISEWQVPPENQAGREVGIATFRGDREKERTERHGIADSRAATMVWTEERRRASQREFQNWEWTDGGILQLSALGEDL